MAFVTPKNPDATSESAPVGHNLFIGLAIETELVKKMNRVLSFSDNRPTLLEREAILRQAGFEVFSANTEAQARFEIEMGRCGVLLICSRTSPVEAQELTHLFRNYCPDGRIIFVVNEAKDRLIIDADLFVLESKGPQAILQALRPNPQSEAA